MRETPRTAVRYSLRFVGAVKIRQTWGQSAGKTPGGQNLWRTLRDLTFSRSLRSYKPNGSLGLLTAKDVSTSASILTQKCLVNFKFSPNSPSFSINVMFSCFML